MVDNKYNKLIEDRKSWVSYLISDNDCNELKRIYENPHRIYDMKSTFIVIYDHNYTTRYLNQHKDTLLNVVKELVKDMGF